MKTYLFETRCRKQNYKQPVYLEIYDLEDKVSVIANYFKHSMRAVRSFEVPCEWGVEAPVQEVKTKSATKNQSGCNE